MSYFSGHPSLLRHFLRNTTAMARTKMTRDELITRAKANSYQKVHADIKWVFESMWIRSSRVKMKFWIVMSCKGAVSPPLKSFNIDVEFQLALCT
jgi:hypothetical protein